MNIQQFARQDGRFVRQYDYEDAVVVVAAGGHGAATADVVDGTVIVVDDDNEQFELELPVTGDAQAFINNGILTIEVTRA